MGGMDSRSSSSPTLGLLDRKKSTRWTLQTGRCQLKGARYIAVAIMVATRHRSHEDDGVSVSFGRGDQLLYVYQETLKFRRHLTFCYASDQRNFILQRTDVFLRNKVTRMSPVVQDSANQQSFRAGLSKNPFQFTLQKTHLGDATDSFLD